MSFEVAINVSPDYIRIASTGEFSVPALFEFIDRVKSEAIDAGRDRVLVDSRGVEGDLSEADRFLAGQRSAEVFGTKFKVAVMMPASKITKMAELAAANRGAKLLVTHSEDEAMAWLLSS